LTSANYQFFEFHNLLQFVETDKLSETMVEVVNHRKQDYCLAKHAEIV